MLLNSNKCFMYDYNKNNSLFFQSLPPLHQKKKKKNLCIPLMEINKFRMGYKMCYLIMVNNGLLH